MLVDVEEHVFLPLADHGRLVKYQDVVLLDDRERMHRVIRSGENADLATVLLGLGARDYPAENLR